MDFATLRTFRAEAAAARIGVAHRHCFSVLVSERGWDKVLGGSLHASGNDEASPMSI